MQENYEWGSGSAQFTGFLALFEHEGWVDFAFISLCPRFTVHPWLSPDKIVLAFALAETAGFCASGQHITRVFLAFTPAFPFGAFVVVVVASALGWFLVNLP